MLPIFAAVTSFLSPSTMSLNTTTRRHFRRTIYGRCVTRPIIREVPVEKVIPEEYTKDWMENEYLKAHNSNDSLYGYENVCFL